MKRSALAVATACALLGCGVSRSQYDAKAQEADAAKQQAAQLQQQTGQLQQQLSTDDDQISQLESYSGMAQSQVMTDDQKAQLEEAKRAMAEAQERGKLLADLQAKLKSMVDAGHLKVTVRHGRIVLQLRNDVLFDTGEADVKPDGKKAINEVAATLRTVSLKHFQVAGHTDTQPITTEKKKVFATNWGSFSTARAIAVVKLLTAQGVDPASVSAAGYGPYDPVASNASADGMAKNRRIEITLVPNLPEIVVPTSPASSAAPSASAH